MKLEDFLFLGVLGSFSEYSEYSEFFGVLGLLRVFRVLRPSFQIPNPKSNNPTFSNIFLCTLKFSP